MGKIEGSWSSMRRYLEQEMPAEALRGRLRYTNTTYVGMDGCHIIELLIDGRCFKQFSWETVNSYFIRMGYAEKTSPMSIPEYWSEFRTLLGRYPMDVRTEYLDSEFCDALEEYRNTDIQTSIRSSNPIVKMFALLDRRVGKRTLERIREEISRDPDWIRKLYEIRVRAEFQDE